jgi:hypothetical protein
MSAVMEISEEEDEEVRDEETEEDKRKMRSNSCSRPWFRTRHNLDLPNKGPLLSYTLRPKVSGSPLLNLISTLLVPPKWASSHLASEPVDRSHRSPLPKLPIPHILLLTGLST